MYLLPLLALASEQTSSVPVMKFPDGIPLTKGSVITVSAKLFEKHFCLFNTQVYSKDVIALEALTSWNENVFIHNVIGPPESYSGNHEDIEARFPNGTKT